MTGTTCRELAAKGIARAEGVVGARQETGRGTVPLPLLHRRLCEETSEIGTDRWQGRWPGRGQRPELNRSASGARLGASIADDTARCRSRGGAISRHPNDRFRPRAGAPVVRQRRMR